MNLLSTTALAKKLEISPKELFRRLLVLNLIQKESESWALTLEGQQKGGAYKVSKQYGQYIVWPEAIAQSKALTETIAQVKGTDIKATAIKATDIKATDNAPILKSTAQTEEIGFRDKFKAEHRSADGHFVRSKAEMLIDNWLYMAEIVHAYERKLPIKEDVYSDFYIPTGRVYIEYWGYENDPKYLARKQKKIELYKKYDFNLIELQDKDVQNLDDVLPRLLLKHGVRAY